MSWGDLTKIVLGASHAVAGEEVTYTPHDGAPFQVSCHFFEVGVDNDIEGELIDIADQQPEAHFQLDPAIPDGLGGRLPEKGDTVTTIAPRQVLTYEVNEDLEPDGEGEVRVRLFEMD